MTAMFPWPRGHEARAASRLRLVGREEGGIRAPASARSGSLQKPGGARGCDGLTGPRGCFCDFPAAGPGRVEGEDVGAQGTEEAALARGGGEAMPSPRAAATEDRGRPGVSGGADAHGHPRASLQLK